MKKTITATLLVIALAFCLAACGSSGTAATTSDDGAPRKIPEVPVTPGESTVDVGDFTLTVPEGWLGVADFDMDEKGDFFIEPYYYLLVKGGQSADDQFVKPTVSVYYTTENGAQELRDSNMTGISSEDETTVLDIAAGGKTCPGYHSVMSFENDDGSPLVLEYDYVYVPATDSSCFRLMMLTYITTDGETGIRATDEDVVAIMESLKVN